MNKLRQRRAPKHIPISLYVDPYGLLASGFCVLDEKGYSFSLLLAVFVMKGLIIYYVLP